MSLEQQVTKALYDVIDPELGINIMDLGLVYGIGTDAEGNVKILMTLTTPGCPMHDSIKNGVHQRISQINDVGDIDINIIWEPPWTPAEISDRGKEMLGFI